MRDQQRSILVVARDMNVSVSSMVGVAKRAGVKSLGPLVRHTTSCLASSGRSVIRPSWSSTRGPPTEKLIVLSDEKLFRVDSHVNGRNNCFLIPASCANHSARQKITTSIMVVCVTVSKGLKIRPGEGRADNPLVQGHCPHLRDPAHER